MSYHERPRRILCLWFPDWPVQRLLATQPQWTHSLVLLIQKTSRGEVVDCCNQLAWRRGVRSGMSASEAGTFARHGDELVIREIEPETDRESLLRVALRCEPFSFCIGLEEGERPECLLMDVTGIAHFFSGEAAMVEQLKEKLSHYRLQGRFAIANTIGLAWAAAHCLEANNPTVIVADEDRTWRTELPIKGLRVSDMVLTKLRRLGIHTLGQLQRLDRASLWARFGEDLLRRIDQLTGERQEMITPCRPLSRFLVKQSLEVSLSQPELIEQLWVTLLEKLVGQFRPKRLGTRHLLVQFTLENRVEQDMHVRLCTAEADVARLAELIRLQLERQRFRAPVIAAQMEALDVVPLERPQQAMFEGTHYNQAQQFWQLLDRLSNRLGEKNVTRPVCVPNAIPEKAVRLVPVTNHSKSVATSVEGFWPLDRPTALFPEPRPIEVITTVPDGPPTVLLWRNMRIDLTSHWGPERIEFGWWLGVSVRRDYYRVASNVGGRLWIFRQLQDDRWFWHGEWF